MKRLVLVRLSDDGKQTLGALTLYSGNESVLGLVCLEPSWKNNEHNISCIPTGRYNCVLRESPGKGKHLHILDVPGRDTILIHVGNDRKDTEGCILPGTRFLNLDTDKELEVAFSKRALGWIIVNVANEERIQLDIVGI